MKCRALNFRAKLLLACMIALAIPSLARADAKLRLIKTRHYQLHTDLEDSLANEMALRLDVMYEEYLRQMSEFKPAANTKPFDVFLFARKADYMDKTEHFNANSGGMFISGEHPFLAGYLEGQGRDQLRKVIQHEGFHQFAWFFISQNLPTWLNEGLAQIFEEGIWTGRTFSLGQVPPWRIRQLVADAKDHRLVEFDKFLAITNEDWGKNLAASQEAGATYYNQAWTMAYFLAVGGQPDYHKRFVQFMKTLHNGMDAEAGWKSAFTSIKTSAFQSDFVSFCGHLKPTPEATMMEHLDVLGDFYQLLSKEGKKFHDMSAFRVAITSGGYTLTYPRGNVKWKTERPEVYFADLSGREFGPRALYFQNSDGPLPSIMCRFGNLNFCVHYYKGFERIEHEVLMQ